MDAVSDAEQSDDSNTTEHKVETQKFKHALF